MLSKSHIRTCDLATKLQSPWKLFKQVDLEGACEQVQMEQLRRGVVIGARGKSRAQKQRFAVRVARPGMIFRSEFTVALYVLSLTFSVPHHAAQTCSGCYGVPLE